jgi:hypothetical protein
VPEEVSTRPGSDSALPSLGPFAALLGQPYQRLKVAVLRELAALPSRWQLAEAQAALTWLEPAEAGSLLAELEVDGLIVPAGKPGGGRSWRLSEEAQLVAAVCAVLAVPRIDSERMVKVLGAAAGLAVAAGTDDQQALAPFLAAVSVLEADRERLVSLIREGAEDELLAVAVLAHAHAADLRALLERQRDDLLKLERGPRIATVLDRAGRLATRVELLASEIQATLTMDPDEGAAQTSLVPSPAELRALIGALNPETLAGLLRPELVRLPLPVMVAPAAPLADALATLDHTLGGEAARPRPAPLPEPRELRIEPMDVVPDLVAVARDALRWLASLREDTPLAKWVVGGSWQEATSRMAAAVEAWSRWGPSGDNTLGVELEARPMIELVGHDAIGVASRTVIRGPNSEPAPGPTLQPEAPETPAETVELAALTEDPERVPEHEEE